MSAHSSIQNEVKTTFINQFGTEPLMIKAPGRINLIGEHTDYNNGFVLPAATDQAIYISISKSDSDSSTLISIDLQETVKFDVNSFEILKEKTWANYILGVVAEIQKSGRSFGNFNMVFSGNVPRGSGMSSSAALECGTCFAINELFVLKIPKIDMVKMSQMAEHNFVGVMCGIMDQFASMMGARDQALLLDCKSLEYKHFPISLKDYTIVLCNSNVTHSLADSEYNTRRLQCEEGVKIIRKQYPGVNSLRDVNIAQLNELKTKLSDVVYKRCKYVIEENERVLSMTRAMKNADFAEIGNILKVAQNGMRYEYEITCPEIDFMADFANQRDDVLGARMMGGGFGGCTINILKKNSVDQFINDLNQEYLQKFGKEITPIKVIISDGVGLI